MDKSQKGQFVGIANFFSEKQIKDLFIQYISLIIVVEIFLLLIILCGSVAYKKEPFPTELYLTLALSIPLGITFVLSVFVMAFNKFVFGKKNLQSEEAAKEEDGQSTWFSKSSPFFSQINKVPFIVKMLVALFAIPILFKLDDIIRFSAGIGAQTVQYLLIAGIIIISALAVIGIIWMIANFRLKRRQMDYEYRYRQDIMEKMDLMVLGNDTLVDRDGRVISINALSQAEDQPKMIDGDYEIRSLPLNKKEGEG